MRPGDLLMHRWAEAQEAVGLSPGQVRLTWDVGPYAHFESHRGYGVTFPNAANWCHVRLASKMARANFGRQDGVIRHEIGHVLDLTISPIYLNEWAFLRGVTLPETTERRADAIAHAVWGTPIFYDHDLVQTTGHGTCPRPLSLGL